MSRFYLFIVDIRIAGLLYFIDQARWLWRINVVMLGPLQKLDTSA